MHNFASCLVVTMSFNGRLTYSAISSTVSAGFRWIFSFMALKLVPWVFVGANSSLWITWLFRMIPKAQLYNSWATDRAGLRSSAATPFLRNSGA